MHACQNYINEHYDIAREGFVEKFDSFLFDWHYSSSHRHLFPVFESFREYLRIQVITEQQPSDHHTT